MQRNHSEMRPSVREHFTDDELYLLHQYQQGSTSLPFPPSRLAANLRVACLVGSALAWGVFVLYPQAAIAIHFPAMMLSSAWLQSLPHVVVGLCYVWGLWSLHDGNQPVGFYALLLVDAMFVEWFWYDGGVL